MLAKSMIIGFVILMIGSVSHGYASPALRLGPFDHDYDVAGVSLKFSTSVDIKQVDIDTNATVKIKTTTDISDVKLKLYKIISNSIDPEKFKVNYKIMSFQINLSRIRFLTEKGKIIIKAVGSLMNLRANGYEVPLLENLSSSDPEFSATLPASMPSGTILGAFAITIPVDFDLKDEGFIDFIVGSLEIKLNEKIDTLVRFLSVISKSDLKKEIESNLSEKVSAKKSIEIPILSKYKIRSASHSVSVSKNKTFLEIDISAVASGSDINPFIGSFVSNTRVENQNGTKQITTNSTETKPIVRVKLQNAR